MTLRKWLLTTAALLSGCSVSLAGSISIDGKTATSVSVGSGGKLHVDIAPADGNGYSHNTYSDFNVPKVGAELDNTGVGARTIINEVTSQNRSLIEGQIEVLGAKADVILANPNGVTVNGGGFVNTGRALILGGASAGALGTKWRFNLSDTDIEVGPEGLTGALDALALIAKRVSISGDIDAGPGALTVKSALGQVDVDASTENWLSHHKKADATDVRLLISAGAHLSGGQITVSADGSGAAVNMAGSGLARAGHFILSADGKISTTGTVEAQKSVIVTARDIEVAGQEQGKARISSTEEAVWLHAGKDLSISQAELEGAHQSSFGIASGGALSLLGEQTTISNGQLRSSGSYTELKATNRLELTGTTVESEKELILAAGSISGKDLTLSTRERLSVLATGAISLSQTIVAADLGQSYEGASFTLASSSDFRSQLTSKTAGLSFKVSGDFANYGGLIEGESQTFGDLNANGTVSIDAGGDVLNATISETSIGAVFAKNGQLYVNAGGDIRNDSGRLLSNNDISLSAENGQIANLLKGTRSVSEQRETSRGSKLFVSSQKRWQDHGTYAAGREIGQIIGLGDVSLQANQIRNIGGQINGADVTLTAGGVENSARQLGSARFKQSCLWFICRTKAKSSLTFDGGQVSATGMLKITATEHFLSRAGVLNGAEGIQISAPEITFQPINYVEYFNLPGGPHNMFAGASPVTLHQQQQALVFSSKGKIRFVSGGVLTLEDTNVFGDQGVEWPDNVVRITSDRIALDPTRADIGWLGEVL